MAEQQHFFEIKDEAIITKVLRITADHAIPVTVWFKEQELKFETKASKFLQHIKSLCFTLPDEVTPDQLQNVFIKQGSQDILASFRIETINFFMKTTFAGFEDTKTFQLDIPKKIFKIQRREYLRIPFKRAMAPKMTVYDPRLKYNPRRDIKPDEVLEFRVVDVSIGGVAIAAKVEDKEFLTKGTMLYDIRFKIRGSEIIAEGIIAHVFETLNDQEKKILQVGIRFTDLPKRSEQIISQFALDEGRKLFTLLY